MTSESQIPVLDLSAYLAGTAGAEAALAAELRRAQEEVGFYYIVNHGVGREIIADAFAAIAQFFALPEETKLAIKVNDRMVGYVPVESTVYRSSKFNENTKKDMNETILLVRDGEPPADSPNYARHNRWPPGLADFQAPMLRYQGAMEALGRSLIPLYALALGKPRDYFDRAFEHAQFISRNSHYPAAPLDDNQFGIAPHSDAGFLTLLPLSDVPGLEILTTAEEWIPAPIIDGAILVNTGEFLNRWTNGRFLATPHRVRQVMRDRYALTFFYNPSDDTVADPIDSCIDADHPAQFDAISLREYRDWYTAQNFLHRRNQA